MVYFLDYFQALLGFVLYRLYTDLGYQYPPKLDTEILSQDNS